MYDDEPDPETHTEEEIAAWRASREAYKRSLEELHGLDGGLDDFAAVNAAAAIVTAANHFHDDLTLIEACNVHTRQLRNRKQFEKLVDHLAVVIEMLAADKPSALIDSLADAIRQQ
jgi:hypothetical protein